MHRKLLAETMIIFVFFFIISAFLTVLPVSKVLAADALDTISPSVGFVGTNVTVTGHIGTLNGSYRIFFDDVEVKSGNASLDSVRDFFFVPNGTSGGHPIRIQDVTTGNYTRSLNFTIQTSYVLKAITLPYPKQLQEGANVTILAAVIGGDEMLDANITVKDPANVDHVSNITILVGQDGFGQINKTYPVDFDNNPHTFYSGKYDVSLETLYETFATENFTIGLTDAIEYNRFQKVNVQALNYTSNDILKITITHNKEMVFESATQNASAPLGTITANWTIPANASLGTYEVNVTRAVTSGPEKPIQDSQAFAIVSKLFACEIETFNLDNEPVEGILVEANSTVISYFDYEYTNEDGIAGFSLEATNYVFTAVLNNTEVGSTAEISLSQNLTGSLKLNITLSLAHFEIQVKDAYGNVLPLVAIKANFTHTSRQNTTIARWASAETNLDGRAALRNLFININYTITLSRYGEIFETININLTSTQFFNTTVPTLGLIVRTLDRNGAPLTDAQVKVYDWGIGLSGLKGTGDSGASGEVTFNLAFGKYLVRVYKQLLLNETTTYVITQPTNFSVFCRLYNLTLKVNIVDYFGQGIPNANVTLRREGTSLSSSHTRGDGVADFTELFGGDYRVLVYMGDRLSRSMQLYLDEPETINLRLAEIVSIGGFITETGHFVTVLLIIVLIAVFLLAFIYRRLKVSRKQE